MIRLVKRFPRGRLFSRARKHKSTFLIKSVARAHSLLKKQTTSSFQKMIQVTDLKTNQNKSHQIRPKKMMIKRMTKLIITANLKRQIGKRDQRQRVGVANSSRMEPQRRANLKTNQTLRSLPQRMAWPKRSRFLYQGNPIPRAAKSFEY